MFEMEKIKCELTLNGASREKNLYKVQIMFAPYLYKDKSMEDIKIELQRNTILFSTTSDEDFLSLLKIAMNQYIEEKKVGKKVYFDGDYIIQFSRLLNYIKKYDCTNLDELKLFIKDNIASDYREQTYKDVVNIYTNTPNPLWDTNNEYDPIEWALGRKNIEDIEI